MEHYGLIFLKEQISDIRFSVQVLSPTMEKMPVGEDCETARKLKSSHMGRLVPMSRFVLFKENDLHYSEGIAHPELVSVLIQLLQRFFYSTPKVLWVDPKKDHETTGSYAVFFSVQKEERALTVAS